MPCLALPAVASTLRVCAPTLGVRVAGRFWQKEGCEFEPPEQETYEIEAAVPLEVSEFVPHPQRGMDELGRPRRFDRFDRFDSMSSSAAMCHRMNYHVHPRRGAVYSTIGVGLIQVECHIWMIVVAPSALCSRLMEGLTCGFAWFAG